MACWNSKTPPGLAERGPQSQPRSREGEVGTTSRMYEGAAARKDPSSCSEGAEVQLAD
jgi:hypothetical protein